MRDHDLPSEDELEGMEQDLREPLSKVVARKPGAEDTFRFIDKLQPEFDLLRPELSPFDTVAAGHGSRPSLWRQCIIQLRSYGRSFWLGGAIIFVMLTLIASTQSFSLGTVGSLFSYIIPLILVAGVLFSFRTWNVEMRMVESVTPYPPALLLLSRIVILLSVCAGYGLISTIYLQLTNPDGSFQGIYFLVDWLATLLLVSGIHALMMLWKGIRWGTASAIMMWALWNEIQIVWTRYGGISQTGYVIVELAMILFGMGLMFMAYRRSVRISYL